MNRVWDYIGFAVWFAGLGYIVMWLFGSSDHLVLSPGLHAIGVAAAMFVPVRLVLRAVGARRLAAQTAVRPRKPARRSAAAAAKAGVPASPGQAAQPIRLARRAALIATVA